MPSSHSLDRIAVTFDDEHAGGQRRVDRPGHLGAASGSAGAVRHPRRSGRRGGHANVGHKAMTLIHSALAGGDSIDDADALRAGATASVLGHAVLAPSTLGTFLRSFTWGHARQLDKVAGELLGRAWAAGAGPGGRGGHHRCGLDHLGDLRRWRNKAAPSSPTTMSAATTRSSAVIAGTGDVVHCRLRGGNANTGRGAASFLTETFGRVRAAGATGALTMRADSGFYSHQVVDACRARRRRGSRSPPSCTNGATHA